MNFLKKEKAVYKDIGKTLDFTFKICRVLILNNTLQYHFLIRGKSDGLFVDYSVSFIVLDMLHFFSTDLIDYLFYRLKNMFA